VAGRYHATKAFVLSLSESIATELGGTGVTMTALCPGPTDTDFFPKADMTDTRAFQKAKLRAPQKVAEIGYEAVMREERGGGGGRGQQGDGVLASSHARIGRGGDKRKALRRGVPGRSNGGA
jgi:NAD(P)-dependent dehydrogenase (short-subunit alcohol dehydrogenase family)